jgi:hypothetical protein
MGTRRLNVPALCFSLLLDFVLTARCYSLSTETCCSTEIQEINCYFILENDALLMQSVGTMECPSLISYTRIGEPLFLEY